MLRHLLTPEWNKMLKPGIVFLCWSLCLSFSFLLQPTMKSAAKWPHAIRSLTRGMFTSFLGLLEMPSPWWPWWTTLTKLISWVASLPIQWRWVPGHGWESQFLMCTLVTRVQGAAQPGMLSGTHHQWWWQAEVVVDVAALRSGSKSTHFKLLCDDDCCVWNARP